MTSLKGLGEKTVVKISKLVQKAVESKSELENASKL